MPLNFCAIGAGRMGRRHIQVARELGFRIEGIFDQQPEAIAAALAEHELPAPVGFDSAERMLAQVRPAAVVIATTAPSHCEYVCASARAGAKFILCEKPMAVSLAECDRMLETCSQTGSVLAVNHQMRFMPQYIEAKKTAASPGLGGLRSIIVAGSNFGLAMNGSHYFETLRFMADEEIASVSFWADAAAVPNPRGAQYQDRSGQLRAVTASGIRLYIELGGDQGHGLQVVYGCRTGQILIDELSGYMRVISREPRYRDLPTTRYGMPADEEITTIAPADIVGPTVAVWRAMLDGGSFPDARCGRHALAGLVAANISAEQGAACVAVDDRLPRDRAFAWA